MKKDNNANYDKVSDNIFSENTTIDFKLHNNKNRKSFTNINNINNHPLLNLDNEQVSQLKYLKEEVVKRNNTRKSTRREDYYVEDHEKYSKYKKSESKNTDDRLKRLPGQVSNNITLLDMNDEEDRDIIILKKLLKNMKAFLKMYLKDIVVVLIKL